MAAPQIPRVYCNGHLLAAPSDLSDAEYKFALPVRLLEDECQVLELVSPELFRVIQAEIDFAPALE